MMIATKTTKTKTVADALYFTDNGRVVCGAHCGMTAQYTLRDISGQRIKRVSAADAASWLASGGEAIRCEQCGRTYAARKTVASSPLLAYVKRQYNKPTFKRTTEIVNSAGDEAAVEFLVQFVREDLRTAERASLMRLVSGAA